MDYINPWSHLSVCLQDKNFLLNLFRFMVNILNEGND